MVEDIKFDVVVKWKEGPEDSDSEHEVGIVILEPVILTRIYRELVEREKVYAATLGTPIYNAEAHDAVTTLRQALEYYYEAEYSGAQIHDDVFGGYKLEELLPEGTEYIP